MPARRAQLVAAVSLAAPAAPATAPAYRIDRHVVPQPVLRYHIAAP